MRGLNQFNIPDEDFEEFKECISVYCLRGLADFLELEY